MSKITIILICVLLYLIYYFAKPYIFRLLGINPNFLNNSVRSITIKQMRQTIKEQHITIKELFGK